MGPWDSNRSPNPGQENRSSSHRQEENMSVDFAVPTDQNNPERNWIDR